MLLPALRCLVCTWSQPEAARPASRAAHQENALQRWPRLVKPRGASGSKMGPDDGQEGADSAAAGAVRLVCTWSTQGAAPSLTRNDQSGP